MISIAFQLILASVLLALATLLEVYRRKSKTFTWRQIMAKIRVGNNHLAGLSFGCPFSNGIECSSENLWRNVGGTSGLLAIYTNVGVLIEAMDYIESRYDEPKAIVDVFRSLRGKAARTRIESMATFARQSARRVMGDSEVLMRSTLEDYFSLVSSLSLAISDHYPELVEEYLYPISKI